MEIDKFCAKCGREVTHDIDFSPTPRLLIEKLGSNMLEWYTCQKCGAVHYYAYQGYQSGEDNHKEAD